MKLKGRKNFFDFKFKRLFFLLLLVSFLYFIAIITNNISTYFMNYATSEVTRLINKVINNSVVKETYTSLNYNDLYKITRNSNNEIEMIDYNSIVVNEFLDEVTSSLEINLDKLEENDLFTMPLGSITKNPLFNNLGPKIPVKLKFISSVSTNIRTDINEYGINNSLVSMLVFIEVKTKIILPLISKDIVITNEVPVSYKLINGRIPNYYGNTYSKNSNLYSIPLDDS